MLASSVFADAQVPSLLRFVPGPVGGTARHLMAHEDAAGFLWIGTERGLLRFDGLQYSEAEISGISELQGKVTAMYRNRQGTLWAGFQDGTIARLKKGRQWELWGIEEGHPQAAITGFTESSDGIFWIATYGEGIYFHDGKYLYAFSEEEGLPGNDIYALASVGDEVWAASDTGISVCSVVSGRRKIRRLGIERGLPDPVVTALAPDGKGNCWVGMYEGGIAFYDTRADAFFCYENFKPYNGEIKSLALWPEKALFIGTAQGEVLHLDLHNGYPEVLAGHESLPYKEISGLHLGREGHLSIFHKGLGHYETNVQFKYLSKSPANTQTLLVDRKQRIWAGTPDGLFVAQGQSKKFLPCGLPKYNFTSLYEDLFGNIWAGTFGQGLYVLPVGGGSPLFLDEKNGISNNSILRISANRDEVWLATLGGATSLKIRGDAALFPPEIKSILDPPKGLSAHFLYTVFADSKGRVWFGSDGKGISRLQDGDITNFTLGCNSKGDTLLLQSIYAIAEDQNQRIWIATSREGLFVETENGFLFVKNIRGREIIALQGDGSGHLLAAWEGGLEWLDLAKGLYNEFGKGLGFDNLQPNLNAIYADKNGHFWLGTTKGILIFTPIETSALLQPVTVLEGVSIFLDPVDWSARNRFSADENNLVFSFSGIWRTDPERIKFRYRLLGLSEDWIFTSDRQASFPNLPPGNYTFEVAAGVNDQFHPENTVRYAFRIHPPIWYQPWFVLLASSGGVLLLGWWIKRREKMLQREAQRRKEIAEMQFEVLKSQVNPHFLFNSFNTLISLIEEDSPTAVAYVEKLSDFFRNILQYRDVELIPIEEELTILRDYLYLLEKRFGQNLEVKVFDFSKSGYVVPLTLQLLVENAVKHNVIAPSRILRIEINRLEDELIVENNIQPRIQSAASTGFGLSNIKKRYGLLDRRPVHIESSARCFRVRIPIIEQDQS